MKRIWTLCAALLSVVSMASAQAPAAAPAPKMTCCSRPTAGANATEAFAMLATNEDFSGGHDAPLPYSYEGLGETIEFKTTDGQTAKAFEIKSNVRSDKYLFVIHEWWGLNDYIRKEAATYAKELKGVNIIALDLYDGQVATTADEAGKLMQAVKNERAEAIIKGVLLYAGPNAKVSSVGWCFGGGWSLQTALLAGPKAVGCVMYYGMPEKDVAKLKTLNTDVLGIFATQDKWINQEVVGQFRKDMAVAKKKVTVVNYDADHAFANPSNPKYSKEFAAQAHTLVVDYLRKNFKLKG
ncbi:dienelactone hydrolase family protein [Hymenobacter lucidus]|uniref:Dienelactone hydrolase family protein n=1 Tax=Hymenobacter lucidus TaxID=2880930 RepID=A0ABS8AQB1_9BACT|nr:dienelactone hydrolase family protein [Hymenobacter lucidus]MCB2407793.1 dienelactone hydrolase family protein [Hymenobacter lucidus]